MPQVVRLRLTLMLVKEMGGKRCVHQTARYDEELSAIAYLWEHPQTLPWIGAEYDRYRLLFVGAAAAPPLNYRLVERPEQRNERVATHPIIDDREQANIRAILATGHNRIYPVRDHVRFAGLERVMLESGFSPPDTRQMFRYAAYYTYPMYPDPALGTDPHRTTWPNRRALEEATATFEGIVETLRPRWICVIGMPLWRLMLQTEALILSHAHRGRETATCRWVRCVADGFPAPDSPWWNRAHRMCGPGACGKDVSGKEKLKLFLRAHTVFR